MYSYKTKGTCAVQIDIELDGDIIKNVKFYGGCDGNHKGICKMAQGRTVDEVAAALDGIKCGMRQTSCPDQLAKALRAAKENA